MNPCATKQPRLECSQCARYEPRFMFTPPGRVVVIDGAVTRKDGVCLLREPMQKGVKP